MWWCLRCFCSIMLCDHCIPCSAHNNSRKGYSHGLGIYIMSCGLLRCVITAFHVPGVTVLHEEHAEWGWSSSTRLIVVLSRQVLEFRIRKEMTLEMWTERQEKIQTFFGPGVQADIQKTGEVYTSQPCCAIPCAWRPFKSSGQWWFSPLCCYSLAFRILCRFLSCTQHDYIALKCPILPDIALYCPKMLVVESDNQANLLDDTRKLGVSPELFKADLHCYV